MSMMSLLGNMLWPPTMTLSWFMLAACAVLMVKLPAKASVSRLATSCVFNAVRFMVVILAGGIGQEGLSVLDIRAGR
ncbi:hypothetical protein [Pseudomonas shirazensis]